MMFNAMKERLKHLLTHNWHLKVLAVILAIAIWFIARAWSGI